MASKKIKDLVYELEKYMEQVGVENMSGTQEERQDAMNAAAVAETALFAAIDELEGQAAHLRKLQALGVDNWEGYRGPGNSDEDEDEEW